MENFQTNWKMTSSDTFLVIVNINHHWFLQRLCTELVTTHFLNKRWPRPHFYQTRSAWSVDQGSNKNHSPAYNFAPTVTKFCVMWEGLSLPHDTKFGNCRCKIVDSRSFPSWSLIHGLRWSGLIKVGPGHCSIYAAPELMGQWHQCLQQIIILCSINKIKTIYLHRDSKSNPLTTISWTLSSEQR